MEHAWHLSLILKQMLDKRQGVNFHIRGGLFITKRKLDALGRHIMIDPYPNGFREEPDGKNSSYSVRKRY